MAHGFGILGVRCTAMDDLGNRCTKDFTHMDSSVAPDRWHDASRGVTERRWLTT